MTREQEMLAEWLREESECALMDGCPIASAKLRGAADEIERLQAEVERLRGVVDAANLCEVCYDPAQWMISEWGGVCPRCKRELRALENSNE